MCNFMTQHHRPYPLTRAGLGRVGQGVSNELTVLLLQDSQRFANIARGNDYEYDSGDDGEDPAGYVALDEAAMYLRDFRHAYEGSGNKRSNSVIPNRCLTRTMYSPPPV